MRLVGVTLNLGNEPVLVFGAGGKPAVALESSVHDSSLRRYDGAARSRQDLGKKTVRGPVLKVFLVGRVAVETDGVVIDERRFGGRQGRLLFAYLVAEEGRAVPRGELAEALWGERPPARWEKALSVLVSKLRVLLGETGIDGARALTGAFGCYRLELPEGSWVDVLAAASAAHEAERALATGALERAKSAGALAESLVGQPFLPGDDGAWVEGKRRELAEVRARALSVLADASLRSGAGREAAQWAEQEIALEPFRESGYRRLMQAHVAAGDRAEALRVYDRCRRLLADELGAYPSPETESIYQALLAAPAPTRAARSRAPAPETGDHADPVLACEPATLGHDPTLARAAAVPAPRNEGDLPAPGKLGGVRVASGPTGGKRRRLALGVLAMAGVAAVAVVALVSQAGGAAPLSAVAAGSVGAVSQASGSITADVPVGSSPSGVAVGQGSVWLANYSDDTVSRINPADPRGRGDDRGGVRRQLGSRSGSETCGSRTTTARPCRRSTRPTNSVVATIPVGNGPSGVAVGGSSVWVANSTDGTLSRIDPITNTTKTIRLGGGPTDVAAGAGAVWVSDAADGRVLRVNPYTNRVTGPINVGDGPTAITVGFSAVWVTNSLDGTVSRINPQTNHVVATFQVGDGPNAIAAGAAGMWVANEFSGTVVLINPATNTVARTVHVGNSPRGLAVAGGLVWVSTQTSVTRLSSSGSGLTQPTRPTGAKMSGGTVYFTEGEDAVPYYIFPMYNFTACASINVNQFMDMMYRPLYWFGNDYRPTVDYGYSIGRPPTFSDSDRTVTIKLNSWQWSDGEPVTSRDLVFWMNVLKANPATEWCLYAPGNFPDNVTSYSAPDPQTFVMHFNRAYDPEWVQYNVLSQLTPLPLAWDRTSLSQPAPTSDNGHLPDTTKAGAAAVYKFLDAQGKKLATAAKSPLWSVVDGPFRLSEFTSSGQVTLVPNPSYSGAPKPTISKLVELPYRSDAASYRALRSGGPTTVTVANIPPEYAPAIPALTAEGYDLNRGASYAFQYFPLNLNSRARTAPGDEPVRYIFRQAYFRQALQHLVDQQGWITAFSYGTANPTCGPIPLSPPSPLVTPVSVRPCAFSVAAAQQLLTGNGWNVVPDGTTTCVKPGTGPGDCGTGIAAGEGISLTSTTHRAMPRSRTR